MMDQTCATNVTDSQSQLTIKLLELLRTTKYELIQENGQRRLTAPEFNADANERGKGAEIFIGRLPRDCYECELMPVLMKPGRLLELRLMLDFSGSTRGYAFALYENSRIARLACNLLDGHEIRTGHRIGVVKSIDNCRLFFGGVPKDKTKMDFMNELGNILDGITDIYLYPNAQDRTQNRGFIFVEFKDHRAAAMARRKLIPGRIVLWNHEIAVDWADPEPGEPIDDQLMESVTALFVRNICPETSHQRVREIIQKSTGIKILKLKKINHFAFVHYENREMAQRVMDVMTVPNGVADRENWEIRWAKPIGTSKLLERERSINEALTNPKDVKIDRGNCRNLSHKKRSKKIRSPNCCKDFTDSSSVDYPRILEQFVFENMRANCHLQCFRQFDGGYNCRVLVVDDTNVILEFQGQTHDSEEHAVVETARGLYQHLRQADVDHQTRLSYHLSRNSENSNNQPVNKIEACR